MSRARAVWLLVARNAARDEVVLEAWPTRAAARRALAASRQLRARNPWGRLSFRVARVPWGEMP